MGLLHWACSAVLVVLEEDTGVWGEHAHRVPCTLRTWLASCCVGDQ